MNINIQKFLFRSRRRFPRAWLQSPRHYVPAGLSAQAFPVGVAVFRATTIKISYSQMFVFFKKKMIYEIDSNIRI